MALDDPLVWLMAQRRAGRPRDPAVMRALLARCGAPPPPNVIHVVGTNGKGTVTHLLAAMAQAAGERVGRFTSPHVERFDERIAVDGVAIPERTVAAFVERVRAWDLPGIGFFEWTLALAVEHFAASNVTLAVIEAGVGAKHDATLALGNVIGTVLTNVDLDHVDTLGPTLADIARDKAHVAKPGVPLVTGAVPPTRALVLAHAAQVGAPATAIDDAHPLGRAPAGTTPLHPPTRAENARLALALGRVLGFPEAALAAGLASPPPPARFERFTLACEGAVVEAILDGAHDPAAAQRLAAALPAGYVLVFGTLERKRDLPTLTPLRARAATVHLVPADVGEGPPPVPSDPGAPSTAFATVEAGLEAAVTTAARSGRTLVVAGSFHLAGLARGWLRDRAGTRAVAGGC